MRIFLIGFMGSGKTFTGRRLAERLAYPFIDLDDRIERLAGLDIPQIFEQYGESYFRKVERDCLRSTIEHPDVVISCGGGTPCFYDNMIWMNRQGVTIYLDTPVSVLVNRLLPEREHRPVLKGISSAKLSSFIEEKLAERSYFYRQAKMIYSQSDANADVASALQQALEME